jgi:hypothetical protein
MTKKPSFFVLGVPRSGTTLLRHLLDTHSRIAVCPEISTGRLLWRLNSIKVIKDRWQSILLLNHFYSRTEDLSDPIWQCFARHALRPLNFPISTDTWYSLLIDDYLKEKGATIYGEKTPDNTFYVPLLSKAFPESKFIILLRNPFDITLSICEIAIIKLKVPISSKLLLRFAVLVKRGLHDLFIKKTIANKKIIFIQYENLIQQTDDTLDRICQFLGVEFQIEMKQIQQKKKYRRNRDLMKLIHGRLDEKLTTDRINRSFKELSPEQITLLHKYLSPEIDYLPYKYSIEKVPLSLKNRIRLVKAKLAFHLRWYMLEEFKNKFRFQLHYFAIRYLRNTTLRSYIFKNLIYRDQDWKEILSKSNVE